MMDTGDQVLLVVDGGPDAGETILLNGPTSTMGRQSSNDVVVAEAGVSRQHAQIVEAKGAYYLRDLSTTNGTFVNGQKVENEDHPLSDGDSIRLAASKVQYIFQSPSANTLQLILVQSVIEPPSASGAPSTLMTDAVAAPEIAAQLDEKDELYEGTVWLNVRAEGSPAMVISLTQQLGDKPEFRVLRMANNKDGGVDLWVALREPTSLRQVLGALNGVVAVSPTRGRDLSPDSSDAPLTLTLDTVEPPPATD